MTTWCRSTGMKHAGVHVVVFWTVPVGWPVPVVPGATGIVDLNETGDTGGVAGGAINFANEAT